METLLNSLYELIKLIIHLGLGAAFTAGLFGSIYLAIYIATPSLLSLEFLMAVLSVGALLGYSVQGFLALTNRNKNRLNEVQTNIESAQKYIDFIKYNQELGNLTASQASQSIDKVLNNFLPSPQETESTNILEPEKQRHIPPSQKEE